MFIRSYGSCLFAISLLNVLVSCCIAKKVASEKSAKGTLLSEKLKHLDPNQLLESKGHQPKIYMQATLELKRLCDQPICHRMAAYLLMNNCKGLDEIDEQTYNTNRGQIQQDQVDAFAATLTMCDMERAKFDVPKSCSHFTSISLMKSAELKVDLKFSSQEVNNCLQGLGKNAKHWATWLSYRDTALLFCRAARLSIERDESIALHRELMAIMKEFTRDLHLDLKELREKVSDHKSLIDSIFKKINFDATDWRLKMDKIFGEVSQNVKDARLEVKNIIQESKKARLNIGDIFSMILRNSSQMAEYHRHEIELSSIQQTKQIKLLKDSLSSSENYAKVVQDSLLGMQESILELLERQDNVERQTQKFHSYLINASTLLHNHTQELEKAGSAVLGIHRDLEKASLTTSSILHSRMSSLSWTLSTVAFGSLVALVVGHCGFTSSLIGKLILIFSGA
ncbi:hypothetical protein OnM2_018058 [Erysiphe neolycopersici]|uniref:Karyogamy protein 5 n=1 Tax=Erysiphe neolycopersici TaxID=212602 RepID=A0A420I412_9PEZI|nr:hypothetical protein OnM2_018058 [Erysiphe neolycopersici]